MSHTPTTEWTLSRQLPSCKKFDKLNNIKIYSPVYSKIVHGHHELYHWALLCFSNHFLSEDKILGQDDHCYLEPKINIK